MVTFGDNFRRLQRRARLNGSTVAQRMGVGDGQISDWGNAKKIPKLESLLRIAVALECTVDELIEGLSPDYDAARRRLLVRDARRAASGELIPLTNDEQTVVDGYRAMPAEFRPGKVEEARLWIDLAGGVTGDGGHGAPG